MWHSIERRPVHPGTYTVRLFTGVERKAFWTGSTWVGNQQAMRTGRQRGQRQLLKLLRQWSDDQSDLLLRTEAETQELGVGCEMDVDDEIKEIIASPGTSYWLRQALEQALTRDCVDASHDAAFLSDILARRCDAIFKAS